MTILNNPYFALIKDWEICLIQESLQFGTTDLIYYNQFSDDSYVEVNVLWLYPKRLPEISNVFIEMSEISIWLSLCSLLLACDELDPQTISR